MSTKCSIIWNQSDDYYFHIYDDWDRECYFVEIEGQIIKVKKEIIKKLVRDFKMDKMRFIESYAEKEKRRPARRRRIKR